MKTLIVVTPQDFERTSFCRDRQAKYIPSDEIVFVAAQRVEELLKKEQETNPALNKLSHLDENDVIPFDEVHQVMTDAMSPLLMGRDLPRGVTGWYYQQFLKMQYARITDDEYYMVWDGDTIPCAPFSMFADDGTTPFFDLKQEYHAEYFETLSALFPGMGKVIGPSFISEHMIIKTEYMRELIDTIEANATLTGASFWEKIIRCIPVNKIQNSSFSEFETYGTFVALKHQSAYRLREWHSFRLAGAFFDPNTICERDYAWLAQSFNAISFEKGHSVREDHKNLFDNPYYQEKLSARQMLEVAQEEFTEGYLEHWNILG